MNSELPGDLSTFLSTFWEALSEAESSGDFSGVEHMCADDLVFVSPSQEPYETLESLIEAWWTPPESYRIRFDGTEVIANGNLAVERGIASDSLATDDGGPKGHRYNYLAVFGKPADGWQLTHFISNMID